MYLEKYKNYIDIFSFTHGVPGINFNKDNLSQIISYKPKFVFFSGGGTMKYNNLVFDRTFTTYDEINNKIFYFRKFKKYYSDLVSHNFSKMFSKLLFILSFLKKVKFIF